MSKGKTIAIVILSIALIYLLYVIGSQALTLEQLQQDHILMNGKLYDVNTHEVVYINGFGKVEYAPAYDNLLDDYFYYVEEGHLYISKRSEYC